MPEKKVDETVNPKAAEGTQDRVAMLSLKSDGTPDQTNPVVIGDKEAAVAAAKRQFAEQAVSSVDEAERVKHGLSVAAEKVEHRTRRSTPSPRCTRRPRRARSSAPRASSQPSTRAEALAARRGFH